MPRSQKHAITLGWLLLASLVTMAFIPSVAGVVLHPAFSMYDRYFPVVSMQGKPVGVSDNAVVIHIWGAKHRECKYVGLQAFAGKGQMLRDANIMRIDVPESGATKPKGVFDIGFWRIWPTDKGDIVRVYVQHDCDGRTVVTKVAEVQL